MTCQEFLSRYTEYRDGLITAPREARHFARHLASCTTCRRYEAALLQGLGALQTLPGAQPDLSFRRRLDRRLADERARVARPSLPARPAIAAGLLVAVALGLVVWEGVRRSRPTPSALSLPPVPFPKPVVQAGVPFVSFQDPRSSVVSGNPYPYGTAFVEPASESR